MNTEGLREIVISQIIRVKAGNSNRKGALTRDMAHISHELEVREVLVDDEGKELETLYETKRVSERILRRRPIEA